MRTAYLRHLSSTGVALLAKMINEAFNSRILVALEVLKQGISQFPVTSIFEFSGPSNLGWLCRRYLHHRDRDPNTSRFSAFNFAPLDVIGGRETKRASDQRQL